MKNDFFEKLSKSTEIGRKVLLIERSQKLLDTINKLKLTLSEVESSFSLLKSFMSHFKHKNSQETCFLINKYLNSTEREDGTELFSLNELLKASDVTENMLGILLLILWELKLTINVTELEEIALLFYDIFTDKFAQIALVNIINNNIKEGGGEYSQTGELQRVLESKDFNEFITATNVKTETKGRGGEMNSNIAIDDLINHEKLNSHLPDEKVSIDNYPTLKDVIKNKIGKILVEETHIRLDTVAKVFITSFLISKESNEKNKFNYMSQTFKTTINSLITLPSELSAAQTIIPMLDEFNNSSDRAFKRIKQNYKIIEELLKHDTKNILIESFLSSTREKDEKFDILSNIVFRGALWVFIGIMAILHGILGTEFILMDYTLLIVVITGLTITFIADYLIQSNLRNVQKGRPYRVFLISPVRMILAIILLQELSLDMNHAGDIIPLIGGLLNLIPEIFLKFLLTIVIISQIVGIIYNLWLYLEFKRRTLYSDSNKFIQELTEYLQN